MVLIAQFLGDPEREGMDVLAGYRKLANEELASVLRVPSRALFAATVLQERGPEALSAIRPLLGDAEAGQWAACVAARVGDAGQTVLTSLAFGSGSPERVNARHGLGFGGESSVKTLIPRLLDPHSCGIAADILRWVAIRSREVTIEGQYWDLSVDWREWSTEIVDAYASADTECKIRIARVLGAMRGHAAAGIQVLVQDVLETEDVDLRAACVRAVGAIGARDREVVKTLVQMLADARRRVRHEAAIALGRCGVATTEVVAALERVADNQREANEIRAAAASALASLASKQVGEASEGE